MRRKFIKWTGWVVTLCMLVILVGACTGIVVPILSAFSDPLAIWLSQVSVVLITAGLATAFLFGVLRQLLVAWESRRFRKDWLGSGILPTQLMMSHSLRNQTDTGVAGGVPEIGSR